MDGRHRTGPFPDAGESGAKAAEERLSCNGDAESNGRICTTSRRIVAQVFSE
jgi:hypothetical protein